MTAGGLMVCGTGSDSGKSTVVAGLCRLLGRQGWRVAPFKAQNMALNSAVTASGHEIGRAQAAQAAAAGVEAEVAMNPVLLKPTGPRSSQVVVNGRPWAVLDAAAYQDAKDQLWPVVTAALADLRGRFDAVVCEGAGSPAEINLLAHDITNLRVAAHAGLPAVIVGDIDRGGVFASLYGTVALLPPELRGCVRGFIINKFRGDPSLLGPGCAELEDRTGLPTFGVLPWLDGIGIDAEDSLALRSFGRPIGRPPAEAGAGRPAGPQLDVAVIAWPRISNFTDIEALALEPALRLRLVEDARALGAPDLLILPGTKSTVADLRWLRERGLDRAVDELARSGRTTVLGICGGYQVLGRRIDDAVESVEPAAVDGLGLLPVHTVFETHKTTRRVQATALGQPVAAYEIHHGVTSSPHPWVDSDPGSEGCRHPRGHILGTSLHGLFENDGFRRRFLADVAARSCPGWEPGPPWSFSAARLEQADRIADTLETNVDTAALTAMLKAGAT